MNQLAILLLIVTHHPAVRAEKLVLQLGAPSYRAREIAVKELMDFGRVGQWAVRRGIASHDAEIAERCTRLLPSLEAETRRRRLEQLRTLLAQDSGQSIPHHERLLQRFLSTAGDNRAARSLYFEMYERHGQLLDTIETSDGKAGGEYFWRYVDRVLMFPDGRTIVDLRAQASPRSEVALLWFLSALPELRPFPIDGIKRPDFPFFGLKYASTHMTGSDSSAALRQLLAAWLKGPRNVEDPVADAKMVHVGFRLAGIAGMHELRPIALRTALDAKGKAEARAGALVALMDIGKRDDLPELTRLVTDTTWADLRPGIEVTIGDLALGACVRIAGLKIDGFGGPAPSDKSLTNFGFESKKSRAVAQEKWREWADRNLTAGGKR